MYLVLLQIESGCGFIVLDSKSGLAIFSDCADVIAKFPSMVTVAWCCELNLADDPEPVANLVAINPEGYLQVGAVEDYCR